jgi:3-dehydroquinate dehydratase I
VKTIQIRGKPVAAGKLPLVCAPLVARSRGALLAEAASVLRAKPDIVEWRVDYYDAIVDTRGVIDAAGELRRVLGSVPLLLTKRSPKEGGERSPLDEEGVVELYAQACEARCADLVDFEMNNDAGHLRHVRAATRKSGTGLILSYHNFRETPSLQALNGHFLRAQELEADVAKVAVMPVRLEDVLRLLSATLESSQKLDIPLISMSMGAHGTLTRLFGWVFGSALTFGIGASGSAPGQVPIEDLNAVIALTRKALRDK